MDPFGFDVAAARAALDEHGLQVSASLGLSEATDISSEDAAVVAAGEALLLRAVDVLAELGGTHLCGVIYSAMKKYLDPATPRGIANSQRVIGRVADHAAECGVQVSVEVVNRYETNILNTSRQALAYLAEVDRPNLGVHLDTYHMNIEESDMFAPDPSGLLGSSRNRWADGDDLGAHANAFIRGKLSAVDTIRLH